MNELVIHNVWTFKITAIVLVITAALFFNHWSKKYPVNSGEDSFGFSTYSNILKRWGFWRTLYVYGSIALAVLLYLLPTIVEN